MHGAQPGALVVDAGCGTGAHARGLSELGYRVVGVDRSPELVEVARGLGGGPEYAVGDLLDWRPPRPAAAVLCRGVLNDLLEPAERAAALAALAAMLAPGGVLVADVRDAERSADRYAQPRAVERRGTAGGREVVLRSRMWLGEDGELVAEERIAADGVERRCEFRMRSWTAAELVDGLRAAGFAEPELVDPRAAGAREDRIVVVASAPARA
jgi:SAM-dependent methyltransferase